MLCAADWSLARDDPALSARGHRPALQRIWPETNRPSQIQDRSVPGRKSYALLTAG